MNKYTVLLLFALQVISIYSQNTFLLDKNTMVDEIIRQMPTRDVEIDKEGVRVNYTFNNVIIQPNVSCPGTAFLKIEGFGFCNTAGRPCVPMRWDSFVIPNSKNYDIIVTDSESVEIPIVLPPAIVPQIVSSPTGHNEEIAKIKPYAGLYPLEIISSSSAMHYGDVSLMSVCVCPVQYDFLRRKAKVYKRINYKVKYNNQELSLLLGKHIYESNQESSFLSNVTLNYSLQSYSSKSILRNYENRNVPLRKDYFIISITEYENAVRKFAEWKKMLGFSVHVKMKDRGEWNCADIMNEVQNMRTSYPTMTHFLIVGDHQDVPAVTRQDGSNNTHVTDYYYCNSSSTVSTIENGRLSV